MPVFCYILPQLLYFVKYFFAFSFISVAFIQQGVDIDMVMVRNNFPSFPEIFTNVVKNSGLTQVEIAKKLGISQQVVSNYMNGKREPGFDALIKISNFFNITLYELTGNPIFKNIEYDAEKDTGEIPKEHLEFIEAYKKLDENDPIKKAIDALLFGVKNND